VITAVDTSGDESADSAPASYQYNLSPPVTQYQVTATAGTNGKLDATTPSPVTVNSNTTTQFKFDANTGYHVATVTNTFGGTGYTNTSNSVSTYTYTTPAITANCGVTASFAINTYTLTYTAGSHGSISGVSPQTVNYDASGTPVTAVPATGYSFVQWSDGLTTASRTDNNVTANITVSATFGINQYQVTATASGNGTGNVSSNPAGINCSYPANNTGTTPPLNYGTSVKLTAVAGTGSTASWGGTCISAAGTEAGDGTGTATCTIGSLDQTGTVTVTFTYGATIKTPKTPTGPKTGITGNTYTYATGGSVVSTGDPVEYQFDWLGDGTDLSSWGSANQSKTWISGSTHNVRARARSKLNPNLVSDPSGVLAVSVTEKPFIHVTSPNGGETWVVGATHTITWNSNYLDTNGTIYLFYWYGGAWHPIASLPASSGTSSSYDWTIPPMPATGTPTPGSPIPKSHASWTSIYIGNWVPAGSSGVWQCFDTNDKNFMILDNGWAFTISGADKGGADFWFPDESSFDGYGISFNKGMFKIQGSYTVSPTGKIQGNYQLADQLSDFSENPPADGTGSITGTLNANATTMTLKLIDQNNAPVFTMSGAWLSSLTMFENWSVQISGSAKGTISPSSPLKIETHKDLNNQPYANVFDFSGSGTLPDGVTPISIAGYFFFTPGKTVYGFYELTNGANSPETGTLSGTLNLSTKKFTFNLTTTSTNGNGHKYTLAGAEVVTP
jgi:hypothetical protein